MRASLLFFSLALGLTVAGPIRAQSVTCQFDAYCNEQGDCHDDAEDQAVVRLQITETHAVMTQDGIDMPMQGGRDPATGQIGFATLPEEETTYLVSAFASGAALMTIHMAYDGEASALTYVGTCEGRF